MRYVLVTLLVAAYSLTALSQVQAQNKSVPGKSSVTLFPDTATITIQHPGDTAKGVLTIFAPSYNWPQWTLRPQPIKQGTYVASVRFPKVADADSAQLGDSRLGCVADKPCPIDYEIVGAKARGTYTGTIDLYAGAEHLATATINVLLPDAGPPPALAGDFLKGNTVEFDATHDNAFFLSLTNPVGSPSLDA